MDDLISRQAAIEIVDRYNKSHMILKGKPMLGAASIVIELEELPSVQPEQKHGKWIRKENAFYSPFDPCSHEFYYVCNQCGNESNWEYDYCKNCGAKMDGETECD